MSSALRSTGSTTAWRRLRTRVLARDGHTCVYCGAPASCVDHIVPRAHGGDDNLDNLAAACRRCNALKGDRQFFRTPTATPSPTVPLPTLNSGHPEGTLTLWPPTA